ncbi:MAG TPA: hypothetical protein VFE98_06890 [Candidatus Bathyarchaeia archaeon]|nr:hypothetical protein [Candidatus Bathyarchaeia archaeon]
MASIAAAFSSILPAFSLLLGLLLVMTSPFDGSLQSVAAGWGLITVGLIVEIVLPVARRLR